MLKQLENPWRGKGIEGLTAFPHSDASAVTQLLSQCPAHSETPLLELNDLAKHVGVARIYAKDERGRMGLGSFKALGASHAIARCASRKVSGDDWGTALSGYTFVTASAGNHGMSVAAGARVFGAKAVIYLSEAAPQSFIERLKTFGAEPVREGATYEDSMAAAEKASVDNGWTLLSDSSWPGYTDWPYRVMEGYLAMAEEASRQFPERPTHILLQAGVGGLAAAVAAHARATWGDAPEIIVVEPDAAPALIDSIAAGKVVDTEGPVSSMGRLDCKTPSMIALAGLARDADRFVTVGEDEVAAAIAQLAGMGAETSPSGGAGLSALLCGLELPSDARVLSFISEGPVDE